MNSRQLTVLGIVAGLAIFIGAGIAVLATSSDNTGQSIRTDGSTTSSTASAPTAPTATLGTSAPPATGSPPLTPGTIAPGTAHVILASTTTTRPVVTTTRPPVTTSSSAPPSAEVGISPTEIRVAVITDGGGIDEGMQAWARSLNRRGGIAGRKIHLDPFDAHGTATGYLDAVRAACSRDFAIAGSLSLADAPTGAADCSAIPDVPVEAVAESHAVAANTYPAFPRRSTTAVVGPYRWLAAHINGCCSQFVLVPDTEPARARTLGAADAANQAGFTSAGTADVSASDPSSRYDEIVGTIATTHATFAASGLGRDSTALLRQAEAGHATDVKVWYCDASCYDQSFVANGGAAVEQEYIAIETAPLSDRSVPALQRYVRTTVRGGDVATYSGLRAFVAGTVFEDAAKRVVRDHGQDGLTRARLLEALGGIHAFTAGGIVGPTDIGRRAPNGCFVLLKVRNGTFKRANPTDKGAIDCSPQNLVVVGP